MLFVMNNSSHNGTRMYKVTCVSCTTETMYGNMDPH